MKQKPREHLSIGFLYDDTLDSSGGVAQYVKTLGAWLSGRGHSVRYLVGETKSSQWANGRIYSLSKNVTVIFNRNHMSMPIATNRGKVQRVLNSENFDVLHVQMPYSPLMSKYVINKVPSECAIVGTFHIYPSSTLAGIGSRLLRILLGRSLRKFDRAVAVSQPSSEFARTAYGVQTDIVPNVIDTAKYAQAAKRAADKDYYHIVFLGRLVERKGCHQLLMAFRVLLTSVPDAKLTIAGDGPERSKLERYVSSKKLSNRVTFLGHIDESRKPGLLASADIACFPSLHGESFGIVLLEAMAAGAKVVIGGNNPGYAAVLGGQRELLIDPSNTPAFAARLAKLLRAQPLVEKLHKWQSAEVKKYDVNIVGPKIETMYAQAIASKVKSRHN